MPSLRILLACALLASVALAGCGGGGGDGDGTGSTTSRTSTTSSTTSSSSSSSTSTTTTSTSSTSTTTTTTTTAPPPTTTPPPPADTTPPSVTDVDAVALQANQATIQWTVDDASEPVSSRVEYGTSNALGINQPLVVGTGAIEQNLTGLVAGKTYFYRIGAFDGSPNHNTAYSAIKSFTTSTIAPGITGLAVSAVRDDRFTVSWTQSGDAGIQGYVRWGTSSQYGLGQSPNLAGGGAKTFTITGLSETATYHFKVYATSPSGNTDSGDQVQRTADLVQVTIGSTPGLGRFNPILVSTTATDLVLAKIVYQAGSTGGAHSWELRDGGGNVVAGFQSPDLTAQGQAWESGARLLAAGSYTMRDRSDTDATGTWNSS